MIVEITDINDPNQQQAAFTNARGEENQAVELRHYRCNEDGDFCFESLENLADKIKPDAAIIWLDTDKGTCCCVDASSVCFADGLHEATVFHSLPESFVVYKILGPTKEAAAAALVSLVCLPQNSRSFIRLESAKRSENETLDYAPHQLQQILQSGGPHNPRTIELGRFNLTSAQTQALWTCCNQINLRVVNCKSRKWNLDALLGRQTVFGKLVDKKSSLLKGKGAMEFLTKLPSRPQHPKLLFEELEFYREGHPPQLFSAICKLENVVDRLVLKNLRNSDDGIGVLCQSIRTVHTPRSLSLNFSSLGTYTRSQRQIDQKFLPLIEALGDPNCTIAEFGLVMKPFTEYYCWSKSIKHKYIEMLQKNTSLEALVFGGPSEIRSKSLDLARAIHEHPKIRSITFTCPKSYEFMSDESRREYHSLCIPALTYLLESDRHFQIKWTISRHSQSWKQDLQPVTRYQKNWRTIVDDMPQLVDASKQQICFRLLLRDACRIDRSDRNNQQYTSRILGLLMSKHMTIFKSALENGLWMYTQQEPRPQKRMRR